MSSKIVAKLLKDTMFKCFGDNWANCNAPEVISSYRFCSRVLEFTHRDCVAIAKC